ncbi:MAG: hypothetical protein KDJ29_14010 [Hyphomicrobiales bacterium]|nr:hypothetical protein [Hyphomicrobiales bacterium]
MVFAGWLIFAAKIYVAIGAVVAAGFIFIGVDRIDPSARGAYSFRPLIVPGLVLLWPLVLMRWLALEKNGG